MDPAPVGLGAARGPAAQLIDAGRGFALVDFGSCFARSPDGGDFVRQLENNRVDRTIVAAVNGVPEARDDLAA